MRPSPYQQIEDRQRRILYVLLVVCGLIVGGSYTATFVDKISQSCIEWSDPGCKTKSVRR